VLCPVTRPPLQGSKGGRVDRWGGDSAPGRVLEGTQPSGRAAVVGGTDDPDCRGRVGRPKGLTADATALNEDSTAGAEVSRWGYELLLAGGHCGTPLGCFAVFMTGLTGDAVCTRDKNWYKYRLQNPNAKKQFKQKIKESRRDST
jgi:hypothetical protein